MTKHVELNNQIMQRNDQGFFKLEKDKEAIAAFMSEVKEKFLPTKKEGQDIHTSRVDYCIENNYYEDFYANYPKKEVFAAFNYAHSIPFEFQSYMAATKFYKDYAMKTDDKEYYLESYADRVAAVALHLGRGNIKAVMPLILAMMEQRIQPATPTFLNAGKARRGELVSCFLLEMDDSLNSINYVLNTCMQLSKIGGGVAVNLSKLRGRGEPIKGVEGAAKGIVPVLKLMEDAFSYADQMGQRKGSGAGYYNIFGSDLLELLDSKKINADEKNRLKTLSIGLIVPNIFYELAERNEPLHLFYPYSVFKAYGQHMDDLDMDKMYYELLANPAVKRKKVMSARDMLTKIASVQLESGYPYIMNKTNANKFHALNALGSVKMSNLCTEIFQLQETSFIADFGLESTFRKDISCNLASLNIANVMELKSIGSSVRQGMRALTAVSILSHVPNAPGVVKANKEMRSVGLGAMNLHGYLAKNKIAFESEEAREFARTFFMMMNFYSLHESMKIAEETGSPFEGFEKTSYADGSYFDMYLDEDFQPKSQRIRDLFAGMRIPTKAHWRNLKSDVMSNGLFHAYRLAIAPTASISYIQNATSSVMPIVEQVETRSYANATTYYPMPFLAQENYFFYKSAYNMNQFRVLDMVAEIQRHIDQGISAVLHVNSDVQTNELARYYVYAAKKGLKSLYYTRTKRLEVDECITCTV